MCCLNKKRFFCTWFRANKGAGMQWIDDIDTVIMRVAAIEKMQRWNEERLCLKQFGGSIATTAISLSFVRYIHRK